MARQRSKSGEILDVRVDLIDYYEVLQSILRWRANGEHRSIMAVNPHSIMQCRRIQPMQAALAAADLVLPDGVGTILAAELLRLSHRGRVSGPTLMLRLCDWGRQYGLRHFFYGGAPGVASRLARRLRAAHPGILIAGTLCPPFRPASAMEEEDILSRINDTGADIVWVGLGAPKQEIWMANHAGRIHAVTIGVGAAFDFHSGNVPWCPPPLRRAGLEWAFRLAIEPRRMWRRNVDSVVFLALVLRDALGLSRRLFPSRAPGTVGN